MADFGIEIREAALAACQANAGEIGAVLGRALDASISIEVLGDDEFAWGDWSDDWRAAGLAIVWMIDERAAVLVLPASSGLVPDWVRKPDPTGQSKLETLALELGMNALPDDFMPMDNKAAWVDDLAAGLDLAAGEQLGRVLWKVSAGDQSGTAAVIFPVSQANEIFKAKSAPAAAAAPTAADPSTPATPQSQVSIPEIPAFTASNLAEASPPKTSAPKPAAPAAPATPPAPPVDPHVRLEREITRLPEYVRSLLRVEVDVSVTLATTKTTVSRVVELGPGAIIQFDKNCESPLVLQVAGVDVAFGEAVKIGDKFGLRVDSISLPPERFFKVPGRKTA